METTLLNTCDNILKIWKIKMHNSGMPGPQHCFQHSNLKILLDVLKTTLEYRTSLSLDFVIPFPQEISSTNRSIYF